MPNLTSNDVDALPWGDDLVPAVVQDASTLQVLMLAYMNRAALRQTLETKRVTFFSRSRQRLWTKGETSGNFLTLVSAQLDCDQDAVLVLAHPHGPVCHRNTVTCFGDEGAIGVGFLALLERLVAKRDEQRPEGSYTTTLFEAGVGRMAQKVGEEGVEVALAAKDEGTANVENEAADLLFHLLVLLRGKGTSLGRVLAVLRERHER